MSSGTCGADVPGIAKHHIKGKYMYVHSEEFKSSNQLKKIQRAVYSSEQGTTQHSPAHMYNRGFLEQNS
jgi:hypothetical protein